MFFLARVPRACGTVTSWPGVRTRVGDVHQRVVRMRVVIFFPWHVARKRVLCSPRCVARMRFAMSVFRSVWPEDACCVLPRLVARKREWYDFQGGLSRRRMPNVIFSPGAWPQALGEIFPWCVAQRLVVCLAWHVAWRRAVCSPPRVARRRARAACPKACGMLFLARGPKACSGLGFPGAWMNGKFWPAHGLKAPCYILPGVWPEGV